MSILAKFSALAQARAFHIGAGRDPFRVVIEQALSATEGVIEGRTVLLFGTNNYLGLSHDPTCLAASIEAVRRHGTGTTGSRIANGTFDLHNQLEIALAGFYRRRSCMVFTTGYQANLGMLSVLAGKDDTLLIDADSHASIYDASRLGHAQVVRFRHNDADDLYRRLRRLGAAPGCRLVVVEGIYSMLGDSAPLAEIAAVKRETGATLLVDEAHSFGVLGEHGRGLAEAAGVESDVDFIVGTFSKSLGSIGGYCVSDHPDFDILRVACRPYMFTASLPPAVIASTQAALARLREAPELRDNLWANARHLHGGLRQAGFEVGPHASPIVAVSLPDIATATRFWNRLLDQGIYVNLVLPPATPDGRPLLRVSVTAMHHAAQVGAAVSRFTEIAAALGLRREAA
ncbi:serine palmitoyltransferase [Lichenicoccus sp.]|uniref:serine palmitoyltransferase n=1 Tax=Lichenicoccus sp. TaxID=2781899 RepID=UPI003D101022